MLTELVKTTTVTNRRRAHYRVHGRVDKYKIHVLKKYDKNTV